MTVESPGAAQRVRFEILGSLRAWRDGAEIDLGPGKQRAVLAVLLLNANRPTPTARIIDAVWADDPPENGVNVVQKYIAGLRRALEPGRSPRTPGQLLALTEAGYTLHAPPGSLDAEAFRDHVARAHTARSTGCPADAAGHLETALALWHDDPLAGLRGPFFDTARDRLAEERAAAFEEYAQIGLDLGHHDRLVPELGRLVAEFPLREQLRYLLILALYRCGRQAEALAAYQDARRFMNEEFGADPGERLQQLHLAILRSDRTLAPEPAVDGRPPATLSPTPGQVRTPGGASDRAAAVWDRPAQPDWGRPTDGAPRTETGGRRVCRLWATRFLAIAVPLLSFGCFSWTVIAFFAARRRSVTLATAAAGYFLLTVVFLFTSRDDPDAPMENVSALALFLSMAGGAVHAALLASGTTGHRRRSRAADVDALRSLELRIRREQALTLLHHHPAIARELRIGRPDLSRVFNDGGLVDINEVPEHILAALPGVTVPQAQQIVARRRSTGRFTSPEDLITYGLLPVPTVRALSDVLIVVDGEEPDSRSAAPALSLREVEDRAL